MPTFFVRREPTVDRAPLGYRNHRTIEAEGRELRTVILNNERAPLVKLAFELYATGNWTIAGLTEHLSQRGLRTVATPRAAVQANLRRPSAQASDQPVLQGRRTVSGCAYPGRHTALATETLWQQVQYLLSSHQNGERTPH
jgi:site-specific DNA recombinase